MGDLRFLLRSGAEETNVASSPWGDWFALLSSAAAFSHAKINKKITSACSRFENLFSMFLFLERPV